MTTPNAETAVAEWRPREVIKIGDYPREQYNVLIPGAFTTQVTPFLRPVERTYTLDPDPEHGEVYVQEWAKRGSEFVPKAMGINALGLANLANVAGILEIPQASGRVDDGRDPGVCTYRSTMFMRLPDGQPVIRTREMTLELTTLLEEIRDRIEKKGKEHKYNGTPDPWKPERIEAEIRKEAGLAKKFFHRKCETGAKSRTHRVMLGIRSKYSPAEIARPFVLAAVVPDVNQPEVRERMLDQATTTTAMLFGGGPVGAPPRQLSAGPSQEAVAAAAIEAGDANAAKPTPEELAELAGGAPMTGEDEGVIEHDPRDGEPSADDDDAPTEPAWMRGQPAADDAPAVKPLLERLREKAASGGMTGLAKPPQLETLGTILPPLGEDVIKAGLKAVWPDIRFDRLSANEAQALIGQFRAAESPEAFAAEWRAMADV